jgi:hypothetical protein
VHQAQCICLCTRLSGFAFRQAQHTRGATSTTALPLYPFTNYGGDTLAVACIPKWNPKDLPYTRLSTTCTCSDSDQKRPAISCDIQRAVSIGCEYWAVSCERAVPACRTVYRCGGLALQLCSRCGTKRLSAVVLSCGGCLGVFEKC